MSKFYTPINVDLHKVGKVAVQIARHSAGDGTKPEDDFSIIVVKVYRDDGTKALTVSSFFPDGVEPVLEFLPQAEHRSRILEQQRAEEEQAQAMLKQVDVDFDATNFDATDPGTSEAEKQHG
jgi:hypothetical protein